MSDSIALERALYCKSVALDLGFHLCAIGAIEPAPDFDRYRFWLDQGYHADMQYLMRLAQMRMDLRSLLPSARSLIMVGISYHPGSGASEAGGISLYARGRDYHLVIRERLQKLVQALRAYSGAAFEARICVDSAPVLERSLARKLGLGWIGRNTCLINEQYGSYFFLGEVLLSLELAADQISEPKSRCGDCSLCISACPTKALRADGYIDARRCLSYLTIEHHGLIPEEFHRYIKTWYVGCDSCQECCPWNKGAPKTTCSEFEHREYPSAKRIMELGPDEFRELFRESSIKRIGLERLKNTLGIYLRNSDIAIHK